MKLRIRAYRAFQQAFVEKWVLPKWMSPMRLQEEREHGLEKAAVAKPAEGKRRVWFHAASVGELESLTPVILAWAAQGGECVVTVLSESARGTVSRLGRELQAVPGALVYAGYSPWEGRWQAMIRKVRPALFVTAKYEAWPELWAALGEDDIPLLIVGAKARRSLRLGRSLCRTLGGRLPRMKLLTAQDEDAQALEDALGQAGVEIIRTGEPRWDRVLARARQGSPRAKELVERFASLRRPWGVLGSVWPEDMEVWRGRFAKAAGSLWVVPHRVDPAGVAVVEKFLVTAGLRVARTSQVSAAASDPASPESNDCVLVDEIGVLLELYSAADWAYVGGGFGVSMHSTIEPAIYGIPVSCGPNGAEKFPEIAELGKTAQLQVIRNGDELDQWLTEVSGLLSEGSRYDAQRAKWRQDALLRLGATERIVEIMRNSC